MSVVNLRPGTPYDLKLQLKPAPTLTGTVVQDGEPVEGARVKLEAPDAVRATLSFLTEGSYFLETAVMPIFPPARQEVLTDERGRFVLTAWDQVTKTRYLEATGPGGLSWDGRLVRPGDTNFELELEEVEFGDSELVLELPGRWQGLPLEVRVNGSPYDPWILPPNEDLRIETIMGGRWHMKLSWHGLEIAEETLRIRGATERRISLPVECIEGQDEESWRRAGRDFPADS